MPEPLRCAVCGEEDRVREAGSHCFQCGEFTCIDHALRCRCVREAETRAAFAALGAVMVIRPGAACWVRVRDWIVGLGPEDVVTTVVRGTGAVPTIADVFAAIDEMNLFGEGVVDAVDAVDVAQPKGGPRRTVFEFEGERQELEFPGGAGLAATEERHDTA